MDKRAITRKPEKKICFMFSSIEKKFFNKKYEYLLEKISKKELDRILKNAIFDKLADVILKLKEKEINEY